VILSGAEAIGFYTNMFSSETEPTPMPMASSEYFIEIKHDNSKHLFWGNSEATKMADSEPIRMQFEAGTETT